MTGRAGEAEEAALRVRDIAGYYDLAACEYARLRRFSGRAACALSRLARRLPAGPIVELGCGTGSFTRFLRRLFPGRPLIGIDVSRGMLAEAQARAAAGWPVRADARRLPLAGGGAALVAGAYFIHHVSDWRRVPCEVHRVLRPGGLFALYTAGRYQISRHQLNRFFRSFGSIDAARFPADADLCACLRECGFEAFRVHAVQVGHRRLDGAFVERVRRRFMSTFALLPADEFEAGLARLDAHVAGKAPPRRYRHLGLLMLARKH